MAPSEWNLPDGVQARPLGEADIAPALLLSQEAGWNQVAADWRIFIELGHVVGLIERGGRLIATSATLPHGGRFGWISMVLVTAQRRRQGLASWLLTHSIADLTSQGLTPVLDATPAGREVYRQLGFEDVWSLHRLIGREIAGADAPVLSRDLTLNLIAPADWDGLMAYDRDIFGADRGALLHGLAARLPAAAWIAKRRGRIAGFILGRDGRVMNQLGPLAAEDNMIALALVSRALAAVEPPTAIDVAERHAALGDWLLRRGFAAERPLTRMAYRRSTAFDDTRRLFAIAGPELG